MTPSQRERIDALVHDFLQGVVAILDGATSATSSPARRAPATASGQEPTMRFGRAKGTPLRQADSADLEWYAGALAESIANPDKARFRADNERHLADVREELASRGHGRADA